jgi:hypothetical protein
MIIDWYAYKLNSQNISQCIRTNSKFNRILFINSGNGTRLRTHDLFIVHQIVSLRTKN